MIERSFDLDWTMKSMSPISASESLWMSTCYETGVHDRENVRSEQDREAWVEEWTDWWNGAKASLKSPEVKTTPFVVKDAGVLRYPAARRKLRHIQTQGLGVWPGRFLLKIAHGSCLR